jgi:hypothetical protein
VDVIGRIPMCEGFFFFFEIQMDFMFIVFWAPCAILFALLWRFCDSEDGYLSSAD